MDSGLAAIQVGCCRLGHWVADVE